MASKISTLILEVDLECHRCYKEIRKVLCKLQDNYDISTISYDTKNNIVTISGPFDPRHLSNKLICKASNVIKEIKIKEEKPKDPPKADPTKTEKEKPNDKPEIEAKSEKKVETKEKTQEPEMIESKSKEKSKAEKEPKDSQKVKPPPQTEIEPELAKVKPIPTWPLGPICCYKPHYEAFHGGCRCCTCEKIFGFIYGSPPITSSGPCYGSPCQVIYKEDPSSCNIM